MNKQQTAVAKFHEAARVRMFRVAEPLGCGVDDLSRASRIKGGRDTSAGFAFSKGLPDDPELISRAVMLEHFREIAAATSLPVNADFQNGFADDPEAVAESVQLCAATGIAGLSIEDSTGQSDHPLYDFGLAIDRIKAARSAIDACQYESGPGSPRGSPSGVVVATGSSDSIDNRFFSPPCEAYLVGDPDSLRTSIERLVAFADAGADCLYAPGVIEPDEIAQIVKAVAPEAD